MIPSRSKTIKPLLAQSTSHASTQLFPAATPVMTRTTGRPKIAQRKFHGLHASSSNTSVTLARTAFPMKAPKAEANSIHPLASPNQSPSNTSSSPGKARVPKQYVSPNAPEAYLAALPREFPSASQHELEDNPTDLGNLRGLFTGRVRQRIANAKYYPRIARRRGMEGQPVIAFTLDKGGQLMKAALAQTSGYQLLDQAALEAVHQAAPYPEIPAQLRMDSFQFKLPISFVLK